MAAADRSLTGELAGKGKGCCSALDSRLDSVIERSRAVEVRSRDSQTVIQSDSESVARRSQFVALSNACARRHLSGALIAFIEPATYRCRYCVRSSGLSSQRAYSCDHPAAHDSRNRRRTPVRCRQRLRVGIDAAEPREQQRTPRTEPAQAHSSRTHLRLDICTSCDCNIERLNLELNL